MAAMLIMKQIDINMKDKQGMTALHYCVEKNSLETKKWTPQERVEMVEYLLMRGAEQEIQNEDGNCALHLAVQNDVEEETILLLGGALHQEGMLNITNKDNKTPIDLCKDPEIKTKLEDISKEEIKDPTPQGTRQGTPAMTPIHTPVQIEVTPPPGPTHQPPKPVSPPPKPDSPPPKPDSPAPKADSSPPKPNSPPPKAEIPLTKVDTPMSPGDRQIAAASPKGPLPVDAVEDPDSELEPEEDTVTVDPNDNILTDGTSLNGGDGNTPMHLACKQYAINTCDVENGNTPIKGNLHYIQVLLLQGGYNGGDINKRNKDGQTPLHISLKMGDLEMADFLVQHGANLHAMDLNGVTTKDLQPEWYDKKIVEAQKPRVSPETPKKRSREVDESDSESEKPSTKHTSNEEPGQVEDNGVAPEQTTSGSYEQDVLINGPSQRFIQQTPNVKDEEIPAKRPNSSARGKTNRYVNHKIMNKQLASTGNENYTEALKVNEVMKLIGGCAGLYGPGLYVPRDMTSRYGSSSKTPRQAGAQSGLQSPRSIPGGSPVNDTRQAPYQPTRIHGHHSHTQPHPSAAPSSSSLSYITPLAPTGSDTEQDASKPPEKNGPPDLKRELSRLQEDVSEMKEYLEELSSEGAEDGQDKDDSPKKERSLQRQMTRLINDVSEVRQELEKVSAKDSTDLVLV